MSFRLNTLALASALLLSACGGSDGASGANGTNGHAALIATQAVAAGAQCASGGTRINAGVDTNGDGTLQDSEATQTTVVCNGAAGAASSMPLVTLDDSSAREQAFAANTRYVINANGQQIMFLTLPSNPSVGDVVSFTSVGNADWNLTLATGEMVIDPVQGAIATTQADWQITGSASNSWNPLATDSTGLHVFAGARDTIQVSSDGGSTWADANITVPPGTDWRGIAATADGSKVIAVGSQNAVRLSSDGGTTWSIPAGVASINGSWERVGMSDDGSTILLAGDFNAGAVYLSKDGGATFTAVPNLPAGGNWVSASVSADGSKLIATQNATIGQNAVIVSTDGGATWTRPTAPAGMHTAVVSGDGSTFVGITHQGTDNSVYVSRDNGSTWSKTSLVVAAGSNLLRVAVSADGKTVGASTYSGDVYLSFNGGATWVSNANRKLWYGLAVSRDGQRAYAADVSGSVIWSASPMQQMLTGGQYTSMTLQYVAPATWLVTGEAGEPSVVSFGGGGG